MRRTRNASIKPKPTKEVPTVSDSIEQMVEYGHEHLVIRVDRETGVEAVLAVHSTALGPGLGGTRLWTYPSRVDAVKDALRLSRAMTNKAAVAGLPLGGGKAVIVADGTEADVVLRAARFRAFGRFVDELQGAYITTEDVGTRPEDMAQIRLSTRHVVGTPLDEGGSGDPSPMTAHGLVDGTQALAEEVLGADTLKGVRFAVQGLGKVGMSFVEKLAAASAVVTATDVRPDVARQAQVQFGIEIVEPQAIYDVECEVFAPCALGAVISDRTIERLRCKVVAGCANNQLEEERHGEALHQLGIVYAVDYVINAGGLINCAQELEGYDYTKARAKTARIYDTVKRMMHISQAKGISTLRAATSMADGALQAARPRSVAA
jgi:leucine dehydrogenase